MRAWCWVCLMMSIAACSSTPEVPSSEGVPRIVLGGADGKQRIWANPQAFRPVPLQLRAKGAEICEAIGAKAAGFHPRALDENGRTFTEGGFYCVKE